MDGRRGKREGQDKLGEYIKGNSELTGSDDTRRTRG